MNGGFSDKSSMTEFCMGKIDVVQSRLIHPMEARCTSERTQKKYEQLTPINACQPSSSIRWKAQIHWHWHDICPTI